MSELWAARDKDGELWLYDSEPTKKDDYFANDLAVEMEIARNLLPELTFEDSPIQVTLSEVKKEIPFFDIGHGKIQAGKRTYHPNCKHNAWTPSEYELTMTSDMVELEVFGETYYQLKDVGFILVDKYQKMKELNENEESFGYKLIRIEEREALRMMTNDETHKLYVNMDGIIKHAKEAKGKDLDTIEWYRLETI